MRLGLLGGTFDPPHLGHLTAARAVRDALGLDRVDLLHDADAQRFGLAGVHDALPLPVLPPKFPPSSNKCPSRSRLVARYARFSALDTVTIGTRSTTDKP